MHTARYGRGRQGQWPAAAASKGPSRTLFPSLLFSLCISPALVIHTALLFSLCAALCPLLSIPQAVNIQQWVDENKASFVPPVCNKLMYARSRFPFFSFFLFPLNSCVGEERFFFARSCSFAAMAWRVDGERETVALVVVFSYSHFRLSAARREGLCISTFILSGRKRVCVLHRRILCVCVCACVCRNQSVRRGRATVLLVSLSLLFFLPSFFSRGGPRLQRLSLSPINTQSES